jgi:16S rRNA processing protein RimM
VSERGAAAGAGGPALEAGAPALVAVARVLRPQGRRGEVRLEPLTDAPARIAELAECWLVPPPAGERRPVEAVWFQGAAPVVKLGGTDTLDAAEGLVGRLLAIPREAVRRLPPDRYYAFDLLGCRVETAAGACLGTVTAVAAGPEHDYWTVQQDGRAWLLPAVAAIVARVDLPGRRIVVEPPEGLVELDA